MGGELRLYLIRILDWVREHRHLVAFLAFIAGWRIAVLTYDLALRPEPITRIETATMVDLDYEFRGIIKYYGRPVFIRTDNGSVVPAVLPGHLPLRLGERVIVKVVLDERGRVAERVVTGYEAEQRPTGRQRTTEPT